MDKNARNFRLLKFLFGVKSQKIAESLPSFLVLHENYRLRDSLQ